MRREPASIKQATRRFGLLDAMILIAATAAGLAATRGMTGDYHHLVDLFVRPRRGWSVFHVHMLFAQQLNVLAVPMVSAWTLGLMACELRWPRPPWRRLGRRPGFVAGAATVPVLVAWAAATLVVWLSGRNLGAGGNPPMAMAYYPPVLLGFSVIGAWTALAVGRRWRPEPTWSDRLGRLLGVYRIVATIFQQSFDLLW